MLSIVPILSSQERDLIMWMPLYDFITYTSGTISPSNSLLSKNRRHHSEPWQLTTSRNYFKSSPGPILHILRKGRETASQQKNRKTVIFIAMLSNLTGFAPPRIASAPMSLLRTRSCSPGSHRAELELRRPTRLKLIDEFHERASSTGIVIGRRKGKGHEATSAGLEGRSHLRSDSSWATTCMSVYLFFGFCVLFMDRRLTPGQRHICLFCYLLLAFTVLLVLFCYVYHAISCSLLNLCRLLSCSFLFNVLCIRCLLIHHIVVI